MEADKYHQCLHWEPFTHLMAMYANAHRGDNPSVTPIDILPARLKPPSNPQGDREQKRLRMERMKEVAKRLTLMWGGQDLSDKPEERKEWVDKMNAASLTPNPIMHTNTDTNTNTDTKGE